MNEEFIKTEQALKLFNLGFDEPCLKYCWNDRIFSQWSCKSGRENLFHRQKDFFENKKLFTISIPTYSQTFKWFNKEYKDLLLKDYGKIPHFTIIQNLIIDLNCELEESESFCVDKLIDIVEKSLVVSEK